MGDIDILVNNAGHNITENFEEISEESFDRMLNVHVKGTFFMTQAVYKDMMKRGAGRIINITSQLAYKGAGTLTHYCAAKGANTTFTRALALECAGTGVLVNAVAPGVTNTDLLTPLADELLDTLKKAIPLNRFAEVDEIAPAVLLLASPEGSFFHGSCISPNGGEVMFQSMYFKNKIIDVKTIKENLVGTWSKLYELDDANKALIYLNDDKVKGRAVLVP